MCPPNASGERPLFSGDLSPFRDLSIAFVTFVEEVPGPSSKTHKGPDGLTQLEERPSDPVVLRNFEIDDGAFAPMHLGKQMRAAMAVESRPFEGGIVNGLWNAFEPWLLIAPSVLHSFGDVAVQSLERRGSNTPKLRLLGQPHLLYAGERAGEIEFTLNVGTAGWLGLGQETKSSKIKFYVNDDSSFSHAGCEVKYRLIWSSKEAIEPLNSNQYAIALVENAPNFIKIDINDEEIVLRNLACNKGHGMIAGDGLPLSQNR